MKKEQTALWVISLIGAVAALPFAFMMQVYFDVRRTIGVRELFLTFSPIFTLVKPQVALFFMTICSLLILAGNLNGLLREKPMRCRISSAISLAGILLLALSLLIVLILYQRMFQHMLFSQGMILVTCGLLPGIAGVIACGGSALLHFGETRALGIMAIGAGAVQTLGALYLLVSFVRAITTTPYLMLGRLYFLPLAFALSAALRIAALKKTTGIIK